MQKVKRSIRLYYRDEYSASVIRPEMIRPSIERQINQRPFARVDQFSAYKVTKNNKLKTPIPIEPW